MHPRALWVYKSWLLVPTSQAYAFHHQPRKVSAVIHSKSWIEVEASSLISQSWMVSASIFKNTSKRIKPESELKIIWNKLFLNKITPHITSNQIRDLQLCFVQKDVFILIVVKTQSGMKCARVANHNQNNDKFSNINDTPHQRGLSDSEKLVLI